MWFCYIWHLSVTLCLSPHNNIDLKKPLITASYVNDVTHLIFLEMESKLDFFKVVFFRKQSNLKSRLLLLLYAQCFCFTPPEDVA